MDGYGAIHRGYPHIFASFQSPASPHLCAFRLTASLPLSLRTLSWKAIKELQKLCKNKNLLTKTCILHLFLACFFNFQSFIQEDDDKKTFKYALLSYRDHTRPLTAKPPPSLPQSEDILYRCPLWSFLLRAVTNV